MCLQLHTLLTDDLVPSTKNSNIVTIVCMSGSRSLTSSNLSLGVHIKKITCYLKPTK